MDGEKLGEVQFKGSRLAWWNNWSLILRVTDRQRGEDEIASERNKVLDEIVSSRH